MHRFIVLSIRVFVKHNASIWDAIKTINHSWLKLPPSTKPHTKASTEALKKLFVEEGDTHPEKLT